MVNLRCNLISDCSYYERQGAEELAGAVEFSNNIWHVPFKFSIEVLVCRHDKDRGQAAESADDGQSKDLMGPFKFILGETTEIYEPSQYNGV